MWGITPQRRLFEGRSINFPEHLHALLFIQTRSGSTLLQKLSRFLRSPQNDHGHCLNIRALEPKTDDNGRVTLPYSGLASPRLEPTNNNKNNNNNDTVNQTMDYLLSRLESGTRWLWLLEQLDEAASLRRVFGLVPARTQVVASQSCNIALINHYLTALPGKTYICCGKSGVGKTMAAMYLFHGDYKLRPHRGIMIRAGDSKDIARTFAESVYAPESSPEIHALLVAALMTKEQRSMFSSKNSHKKSWHLLANIQSALRGMKCFSQPFEVELLKMGGKRPLHCPRIRQRCQELPLLIIDGLSSSQANSDFVGRLYEEVKDRNVSALILVKEEDWANALIRLNGGIQILPVDQVISNPRGENLEEPFVEVPKWNHMVWRLGDIEEFAALENITDVHLHEGMTPQDVLDLHARIMSNTTDDYGWGRDG